MEPDREPDYLWQLSELAALAVERDHLERDLDQKRGQIWKRVKEAREIDVPVAAIAEALGVHPVTLHKKAKAMKGRPNNVRLRPERGPRPKVTK
jgi:hypothetical protein